MRAPAGAELQRVDAVTLNSPSPGCEGRRAGQCQRTRMRWIGSRGRNDAEEREQGGVCGRAGGFGK